MVRLKDGTVGVGLLAVVPFQFLHGAIKRVNHNAGGVANIVFQFLHGAIKSYRPL